MNDAMRFINEKFEVLEEGRRKREPDTAQKKFIKVLSVI